AGAKSAGSLPGCSMVCLPIWPLARRDDSSRGDLIPTDDRSRSLRRTSCVAGERERRRASPRARLATVDLGGSYRHAPVHGHRNVERVTVMRIRAATVADATQMARVYVEGWRFTYRGLVPDIVLDGLSYERRERLWRERLTSPQEGDCTYVAED